MMEETVASTSFRPLPVLLAVFSLLLVFVIIIIIIIISLLFSFIIIIICLLWGLTRHLSLKRGGT